MKHEYSELNFLYFVTFYPIFKLNKIKELHISGNFYRCLGFTMYYVSSFCVKISSFWVAGGVFSSFCVAFFPYFVIQRGVFSLFRLFAWRFSIISSFRVALFVECECFNIRVLHLIVLTNQNQALHAVFFYNCYSFIFTF